MVTLLVHDGPDVDTLVDSLKTRGKPRKVANPLEFSGTLEHDPSRTLTLNFELWGALYADRSSNTLFKVHGKVPGYGRVSGTYDVGSRTGKLKLPLE